MMEHKRFFPKYDTLFHFIWIPTAIIMLFLLVMNAFLPSTFGWIVTLVTTVVVAYFVISPMFGYVELRETCVFVKFGFFMRRVIPYETIRGVEKKRTAIADSMVALKNAMEHVNIKHGSFDVTSVSVKDGDAMMAEIRKRCGIPE